MASPKETRSYCCKCPCGAGTIQNTCVEFDNMYSTDDWSYDIECSKCSVEWRVSGNWLEEILPPDPRLKGLRQEAVVRGEMVELAKKIIDARFEGEGFPNPKEEFSILKTSGFRRDRPVIYKRARAKLPPSALCDYSYLNVSWLKENCKDDSWLALLNSLSLELSNRPSPRQARWLKISDLSK